VRVCLSECSVCSVVCSWSSTGREQRTLEKGRTTSSQVPVCMIDLPEPGVIDLFGNLLECLNL